MAPPKRRRPTKAQVRRQSAIEFLFAVGAVLLILVSITAYSGVWPPMVVVESGSMMHDNRNSALGVIDTGDLTLVKKTGSDFDVITYMQGMKTGYKTYGAFGDVIIYSKNGFSQVTPIIHRAITRIVLNETTKTSFDFPELEQPLYDQTGRDLTGRAVPVPLGKMWTWDASHPGGQEIDATLDLATVITRMGGTLTGGILTKGDHNEAFDQERLNVGVSGHANEPVRPVQQQWIIGVARGELPWFGLIKLFFGRPADEIPPNSQTNLIIALAAIIVVPFATEWAWDRYGDRVKSRVPAKWAAAYHGLFDKFPGGARRKGEREEMAADRAREQRRRGRHRSEEE